MAESLRSKIREVPDFPQEGILFYDITTVMKDPVGFHESVDLFAKRFANIDVDVVAIAANAAIDAEDALGGRGVHRDAEVPRQVEGKSAVQVVRQQELAHRPPPPQALPHK